MNIKPIASVALVSAVALAFSGCASNEGPAATQTLSGSGASSQQSAQTTWTAAFQKANNTITVNYAPDGSGAGRSAFTAGAVQFAGSDRPLKDEEMGAGKFTGCAADSNALNLPVYVSPIAVIYNLAGVDNLSLDPTTLAGIFAGKIKTWNDPAIVKLNPGAKLPSTAITAVHRADDSGTTNNFTDTLNKLAPAIWTEAASDTFPAAFGGEAANKTAGMVSSVSGGTGTIGYADASAAKDVSIAEIVVNGKALKPTAEAAAAILDQSKTIAGRDANDLAFTLDRTSEGAYPAVLVSYVIVCQRYKDANAAKLVKSYIGYVASAEGQQAAAAAAGSAPLSAGLQAKVKAAVDSIS